MISGRDFVFTGLQAWDIAIGSNARDIATQMALTNRVIYVNTPLSVFSDDLKSTDADFAYRQKVLYGQAPPVRHIADNLWLLDLPFTVLPASGLPDGFLFDTVNRLNNLKIFSFVAKMAQELGFVDIIHFNDNDIYRSFYAKEYLKPKLSIYYRRDNLLAIDFWRRHSLRLEPQIIAKSDLVLCNSDHLASVAREYNCASYDVGQGVELSIYTNFTGIPPDDMAAIARPIIGYLGHLTSLRLDPYLLHRLAIDNPNYSFVLVGACDDVFASHSLHLLANVHFLGSKPTSSVPNYISAFDICINPQAVNELTMGNYPRKIDEYLALGKPVVATKTQAMEMFKDYVHLCRTENEYNAAFTRILQDGPPAKDEKSIQFAHTHTWANSVNKMYDAITEKLK